MQVLDARICELGEGPLWHPLQKRWYWFDILNSRLLGQDDAGEYIWQFDEMVSAAGWIDKTHLVVASETQLFKFNTATGEQTHLHALEADNKVTRSNDGRADPWGGFWIGTMGKKAEPGAGAIYRYYAGQLRQLYRDITISNAICFAHDQSYAYFTDTPTKQIMRQPLDNEGWPTGTATVWVDLTTTEYNPDGAVVDADNHLWNAQWGASRVARYNPQGEFVEALSIGASQTSCPAFGGAEFTQMLVTTAAEGLGAEDPLAGQTFITSCSATGRAEYQVKI
jgi:sugar lactone lactonase YvrE